MRARRRSGRGAFYQSGQGACGARTGRPQGAPLQRSSRLRQQLPQQARAEWNFEDFDAARGEIERILDRLREQRTDRYGARLAGALDAERIEWRRRHGVAELHAGHVERGRQQIVGERGVEQLSVVIEFELLVECIADSLRDTAMDL